MATVIVYYILWFNEQRVRYKHSEFGAVDGGQVTVSTAGNELRHLVVVVVDPFFSSSGEAVDSIAQNEDVVKPTKAGELGFKKSGKYVRDISFTFLEAGQIVLGDGDH